MSQETNKKAVLRCGFCDAPWTGEMMTELDYTGCYDSGWVGAELSVRVTEIYCDKCKRRLYVRHDVGFVQPEEMA